MNVMKSVCVGGGGSETLISFCGRPKPPTFILYAFLNSPRLDKSIAAFSFYF